MHASPITGQTADRNLLERLQARDERALDELISTYGPRVYQLAFRYLHNREDAEEVAQDVLYQVYRKAGAFRGDSALSSWIFRITFNASMSRLRSASHRRASADEPLDHSSVEAGPSVMDVKDRALLADERVFRSQLRRRLYQAILALPAIYRAPVLLRDVQGMSTEEASQLLRVKDQTLKSRLHRGRVILRRQLADLAGGVALHRAA
jgi:RNA polymerase sigma-70 factor (ECF subfamily)